MRNSFWACLVAIAVGGISLLVKAALPDQPWLAWALFYSAIVIGLLAILGLARDTGLPSRTDARMRTSRVGDAGTQAADRKSAANAGARAQVPRPAGPVGPVPVLQKQPRGVPADNPPIAQGTSPESPIKAE